MKNEFTTSDLPLAATLLTYGVPLQRIDRTNLRRAVFLFSHSSQVENVVKKFWARTERVDPLALNEQMRYLKSLIYQ